MFLTTILGIQPLRCNALGLTAVLEQLYISPFRREDISLSNFFRLLEECFCVPWSLEAREESFRLAPLPHH